MSLPFALLLLIFLPSVFPANLSSNDPFRTFSSLAASRQHLPVCCLKPLSPHDPVGDEVLLSFDEWKAKQWDSIEHKEHHIHSADISAGGRNMSASGDDSRAKFDSPVLNSSSQSSSSGSASTDDIVPQNHQLHPRVPLTDRFNYASLDCSARVHGAHRSAKSPSNVLSSKRDRYMLSPCKPANGESQFIIVELCEDIRIDTVQLANFEFFSGVFKEFSVRVAKTDATNDKSWEDAGAYRAKNIRGVQSFHPPTSLRDFYRYIRIDFHSHYGNEYYCPLSLLRVYGLTHLEEYKWEQWEEESKGKTDIGAGSSAARDVVDQPSNDSFSTTTPTPMSTGKPTSSYVSVPSQQPVIRVSQLEPGSALSTGTGAMISDDRESSSIKNSQNEIQSRNSYDVHSETSRPLPTNTDISLYPNTADSHTSTNTLSSVPTVYPSIVTSGGHSESTPSVQHSTRISTPVVASPVVHTSVATSSIPSASQTAASSSSGESIYRVIMNRLTALEANHTLYVRYVEQQNTAIRDLLKRMGEDVGRLEGIGRAHGQSHQRAVQEWERQRQQLQMELREFMAVVEYLSDEIALEKRLGIAQLCLLLLVLVFMALTRGSRGEPLVIRHDAIADSRSPKYKYLRELSRRLNLSTDWTRHSKSDSSTDGNISLLSNQPQAPSHSSHVHTDSGSGLDDFVFPRQKLPFAPTDMNIPSSLSNLAAYQTTDDRPRKLSNHSRSRTSSHRGIKRNPPPPLHLGPHAHSQYQNHQRTLTPSKSAMLRRSNSHNSEVYGLWSSTGIPRSAKAWAKSAHLHEVVRTGSPRRRKDSRENQILSAADLGQTRHRHMSSDSRPEAISDVSGGQIRERTRFNRKESAEREDMDGGLLDSDQSAWEDTDSVPGELFDT